jgi:hypothetical protein
MGDSPTGEHGEDWCPFVRRQVDRKVSFALPRRALACQRWAAPRVVCERWSRAAQVRPLALRRALHLPTNVGAAAPTAFVNMQGHSRA